MFTTLSVASCLGCMIAVFFCAAFVELRVTSANHTTREQEKQTCSEEQFESTPSEISLGYYLLNSFVQANHQMDWTFLDRTQKWCCLVNWNLSCAFASVNSERSSAEKLRLQKNSCLLYFEWHFQMETDFQPATKTMTVSRKHEIDCINDLSVW